MTKDGDDKGQEGGKETRDEECEERRKQDSSAVSINGIMRSRKL